jgi:GntR family transcriptional regulator, transcriptional repressor for pyruvate dehydrogenase complex
MKPMPRALDTRTPVSQTVFSNLRNQILRGDLEPGGPVPSERALAEIHGISRHAVREALKRLQQAGLVDVSQGGATRVLDWHDSGGLELLRHLAVQSSGRVDAKVLRSALEMRISIGADAARLCAGRAVGTVSGRLLEIAEEMGGTDDVAELAELDAEFWALVIDGADNIAYRLAFNSLVRSLSGSSKPGLALVAGELLDPDGRRAVAQAIAEGDAEGAERAARQALSGGLEAALEFLAGTK